MNLTEHVTEGCHLRAVLVALLTRRRYAENGSLRAGSESNGPEIAVAIATCCNRTMEMRGVDGGTTGAELSNSGALGGLPGPKDDGLAVLPSFAESGDTITAILGELSDPEVVRFLERLEQPPLPEMAARLEDLIRASVSAVAEGNVQQALTKLKEFAALNPRLAETLDAAPGLASIREEVGQLLSRLTSAAQLDAEFRFGHATHLVQAADQGKHLEQEIKPEIAILIAGRLLEAGGYANSMRSTELSQMLINQYGFAPTAALPIADPSSIPFRSAHASLGPRNQWIPRIRRWWHRAPLLVMLLAWFAAGFSGGCVFALLRNYWPEMWPESLVADGFEVWGLGFLALIGFGFYARVRNIRW
jgi:hypothetical protein